MLRKLCQRVSFRLQFTSQTIENEFINYRRPLFQRFFFIAISTLFIISLVTVIGFDNSLSPIILSALCVPAIVIFFFLYKFRKFKYLEGSVTIACLVLNIAFFYYQYQIVTTSEDLATGFFAGFVERIVVERLPMFRHKAIFTILSGIARITIFKNVEVNDYVFRISLPIFALILDFNREKKERGLFKSFYDSREGLVKFKELFKSQLPESILILQSDLEKALFVNEAFQKNFGLVDINSIKSFLKNLKLTKEHIRASLTIKKERTSTVEQRLQSQISELARVNGEENLTLYNLMEEFMKFAKYNLCLCSGFAFNYTPDNENETKKVFKIKIFPFIWDGENSTAVLINDITEQYALINLKLENENKDKVVATVSHELRTPLNGILGMLQILQKEVIQPDLAKYLKVCHSSARLLLSLVNSILDLNQIKNNKLKLNLDKYGLKDFMDNIISLFDFQCQQKNLYLRLEMDPGLPKVIITDKDRLTQIIINLIGNAMKFTFKGGIILKVSKDTFNSDSIVISVSDTGVGIKDQEKSKLFQMYGKLEGTEKINKHGVGLGLNISNTLAKLLNGNEDDNQETGIGVDSEYDKGSTFSFKIKANLSLNKEREEHSRAKKKNSQYKQEGRLSNEEREMNSEEELSSILDLNEKEEDLNLRDKCKLNNLSQKVMKYISSYHDSSPFSATIVKQSNLLQKESSKASYNSSQSVFSQRKRYNIPSPSSQGRETISDKNFKVLVVDDNPFNLLVARRLIEMQGSTVETALNGMDAIKIVIDKDQLGNPFDLILMDCEMPGTDGYQTTRLLINKMKTKEIDEVPIVALTANNAEAVIQKCLEAGMTDCLTKPLMEEDLKKVLQRHIPTTP